MKLSVAISLLLLSGCSTSALPKIPSFDSHKWNAIEPSAGYQYFNSIKDINNYVNAVPYKADNTDDWKTPERFFKEGGDCEDYAIAKYTLIKQNQLSEDISIAIVKDLRSMKPHAVLIVDDLILDNQVQHIMESKEAVKRYQFLGKVRMTNSKKET